jgi:hypothetical protein
MGGLTAAVFVLAAAPASAGTGQQTLYAAANGTGTAPCTVVAPCSLPNAIDAADGVNQDIVNVLPGTYTLGSTLLVEKNITVQGQPGKRPPLILSSGSEGIAWGPSGGTLRRLRVEHTGGDVGILLFGIAAASPLIVEQLQVTSTGFGACAGYEVTIRDTLCLGEGAGADGIRIAFNGDIAAPMKLTNVTAVSRQDQGLFTQAEGASTSASTPTTRSC